MIDRTSFLRWLDIIWNALTETVKIWITKSRWKTRQDYLRLSEMSALLDSHEQLTKLSHLQCDSLVSLQATNVWPSSSSIHYLGSSSIRGIAASLLFLLSDSRDERLGISSQACIKLEFSCIHYNRQAHGSQVIRVTKITILPAREMKLKIHQVGNSWFQIRANKHSNDLSIPKIPNLTLPPHHQQNNYSNNTKCTYL